ncbi:hypothetical protein BEWA_044790 [Theileria equi strain WA]|uniref:Uncharacterized protein n=1 Tax=Theileria equi strain WA TaxID=1537102 RepID=L1LGJ2_THEEQ|nr:hypothetical protein BEWA_044790 [Theileria equi strain WA]EKX74399.1 hypothetical protein BEWA_044790 [Theileria equi strain WA]|eukprot:XP_004833851.1 hypothetical protein BEWA_044790 [Theileria equi strain WA]
MDLYSPWGLQYSHSPTTPTRESSNSRLSFTWIRVHQDCQLTYHSLKENKRMGNKATAYVELSHGPKKSGKYNDYYYDNGLVTLKEDKYPGGNGVYKVTRHTPKKDYTISGIYHNKCYQFGFENELPMGCNISVYFGGGDSDHMNPLVVQLEAGGVNNFYYPCILGRAWAKTRLINPETLLDSLDVFNCSINRLHTVDLSVRTGISCRGCRDTKRVLATECETDGSYYRTTHQCADKSPFCIKRLKEGSVYQISIPTANKVTSVDTFFLTKEHGPPLVLCISDESGSKWYRRVASNLPTLTEVKDGSKPSSTDNHEKIRELLTEAYAPSVVFDSSKGPTGDHCSYIDSFSGETIEVVKTIDGKYVKLTHLVRGKDTFRVGGIVPKGEGSTKDLTTTDEVLSLTIFYWVLDPEYQSPLLIELEKPNNTYDYYTRDKEGNWNKDGQTGPKKVELRLETPLNNQNCKLNGAHIFNINGKQTPNCKCPKCVKSMTLVKQPLFVNHDFWKLSDYTSINDFMDGQNKQTGIPCFKGVTTAFVFFDIKGTDKPLLVCVMADSTNVKASVGGKFTWFRRDSINSTSWSVDKELPPNPESCLESIKKILENFPENTKTLQKV